MSTERKNGLDFLRFAACIGILFLHFSNYFCPDGVFFGNYLIDAESDNNIGINMNVMVEIFFALSGYLLYYHTPKGKDLPSLRSFILPKLIRIIPMLTVGTILWTIAAYCIANSGNNHGLNITYPYLWGIISSCLGLEYSGFFIPADIFREGWYLDVLIECYFLYYIIIKTTRRFGINEKLIVFFAILLGAFIFDCETGFLSSFMLVGRGLEAFFSGVLVATLNRDHAGNKLCIYCLIPLIAYLICLLLCPLLLSFGKTHLINLLITPCLITILTSSTADIIFRWKGWRMLGQISYSTYILHIPAILFIFVITDKMAIIIDYAHEVILFSFICISIIIGFAAYYLIERPITKRLTTIIR